MKLINMNLNINNVCQRIATGIYYILKAGHIFPKRILHSLYISFIEPHQTYGIESWGTASPSILKPLHILQKRAVRIMHFLPPSTSVSEVFPTSGILHIHQLAYYRLVMFMQILIYEFPNCTDIQISEDSRNLGLRSTSQALLNIGKARTNYGKLRINYIGCKIWNELDNSLKRLKSFNIFKKELKNFVICTDANLQRIIK